MLKVNIYKRLSVLMTMKKMQIDRYTFYFLFSFFFRNGVWEGFAEDIAFEQSP